MSHYHFSPVFSFIHSCGADARVGIVGSRWYIYPYLVRSFVADLPVDVVVVSGDGGIVDKTAVSMAKRLGLTCHEYPAVWDVYGRAAGPIRNRKLARSGLSCLVVFLSALSNPSDGSRDAIKAAKAAGVPVFIFGPPTDFLGPWFNNDLELAFKYSILEDTPSLPNKANDLMSSFRRRND